MLCLIKQIERVMNVSPFLIVSKFYDQMWLILYEDINFCWLLNDILGSIGIVQTKFIVITKHSLLDESQCHRNSRIKNDAFHYSSIVIYDASYVFEIESSPSHLYRCIGYLENNMLESN